MLSNSSDKMSKAAALTRLQAIMAGTAKHFPNGTFTLGNVTYTTAQLTSLFQGLASAYTSLDAAQSSAKDAMSAVRNQRSNVEPVLLAYKRLLLATYGNATQTLADFGLQPAKGRTPQTSQAMAAAAVKGAATRKARGTASKKEKLAVKGDVTGVLVTPITQPSPSTSAAPAAPPASNGAATGGATKSA